MRIHGKVLLILVLFMLIGTFSVFAAGEKEGGGSAAQPGLDAATEERLDFNSVEDYRSEFDIDEFPKNEKYVPYWLYDRKEITYEWFIDFSWYASTPWDSEKTLLHKLVKEETGIDLELVVPASGDEKLNAIIAANDLPDIITDSNTSQQLQLLIKSGRVYALNELIDQYAPEFWDWVPPSLINWFTEEDGNWYIFPNFFDAPEHVEEYGDRITPKMITGIWARKDIMDELGIQPTDFQTQEGLIQALKKVKNSGITYNGQELIPAIIGENGGISDTFEYVLPNMFAIPLEDKNGDLIDWRTHPKALEMIQFGNRLVREGLVIPENLTATDKQIDQWSDSGRAFLGLRGISDIPGTLVANDPNVELIPVDMVRAKDGAEPVLTRSGTGWTGTVITKQASDPERIIRFFEYIYANPVFWEMVQQEKLFTWDESNGRVVWTQEYLDVREGGWKPAALKFGTNRFYWLQDRFPINSVRALPTLPSEKMIDKIRKFSIPYGNFTNAFAGIEPDGGTPERAQYERINDYWEEELVKMLINPKSDAEVEEMWKATLKRMRELGSEEIIAIQNEKFHANKSKLKISRAWPAEIPE